jgi:tRNA threonylcarbamoyladenosine biosynthesis protein TsaB
MPSLRSVLNLHGPALVLDAASSRVQVGWLKGPDDAGVWQHHDGEAGDSLFRGLESLGCDVLEAGCFLFCAGPGSLLGIRTTAVLLRTWTTLKPRPCFSYQSLELVARGPHAPGMAVIADARRDMWHVVARDAGGAPLPVQRIPAQDLPASRCMPEHFRHWAPLPSGTARVPYHVGELLRATANVPLLHESPELDAFLHEDPQYVTWTPRVHQAPSSSAASADVD